MRGIYDVGYGDLKGILVVNSEFDEGLHNTKADFLLKKSLHTPLMSNIHKFNGLGLKHLWKIIWCLFRMMLALCASDNSYL